MSRGKSKRTLQVLAAVIEILREIQPASVRAVCYQLFGAKLLRDMGKSSTNSISRLLTIAREEKQIPWSWIVDESREAETASRWSGPDEIIRAAVTTYRRDQWQDQDFLVEVWSEKGTVRGTLAPILDEYGVTFRVMHGYASATVVNAIAELSTSTEKPLIALYVGDWDPSGKHMSDEDLPRRLEEYGANVILERIALLANDLKGLPSFDLESKSRDPRYRWFKEEIGTSCYELDAMRPPVLRARVEQQIREYIDIPIWEHARMIERTEIESMQQFYQNVASMNLLGSTL
jgi:hypothetical protein